MPYIERGKQVDIDYRLKRPENSGELNYAITQMCIQYIRDRGLRYQYLNDVIGALDGASKEFYRRVVAPYEDTKIKENGDVE